MKGSKRRRGDGLRMSYTELVFFNKEGFAVHKEEVQNAWRGAMAIWRILEDKYLPIFRTPNIPKYLKDNEIEGFLGYKPTRTSTMYGDNPISEITSLYHEERLSEIDRIVLATTFDRVLVKKKNFEELIKAFEVFEGNTRLLEQAEIIKNYICIEDIIAVGWNQTSVSSNLWLYDEYDEDEEEYIPYNCLTGEKHFWLFE